MKIIMKYLLKHNIKIFLIIYTIEELKWRDN